MYNPLINYLVLGGAPQHRGVAIKTSRFNHSCQPNATALVMENDQNQIRAIKGTFLSENTGVLVITSNGRTFFLPETENLNFGDF